LQDIGIDYAVRCARKFGFNGAIERNLSLALGATDLTLIELVSGYTVFCTNGIAVEPLYITRILDRDGKTIEENLPRLKQALSPQTAYLVTSLLHSVVEEGTGKRVAALNRPCAGKTGTTNDFRDAWFIGFTPQLVTGAWIGFDDNSSLGKRETGGIAAAPIWLKFMQEVLKDEPVKMFEVPQGIVFVKIHSDAGTLSDSTVGNTLFECFKEGSVPMSYGQPADEL
jgi:penicillin-binding protein 1A